MTLNQHEQQVLDRDANSRLFSLANPPGNELYLVVSRWVESSVERAYGDKTFASVGFRSSTATYIICNLITPAYLQALKSLGDAAWA
ncbi:MAG: hypothetical protein AAF827_08040 [Cyanobacteria bacterium P01_D01_bin.6]